MKAPDENAPAKPPKSRRVAYAKAGTTAARAADKKAVVLKMVLEGHRAPAIGEALGVSRQRAWQLATEAMADLRAETLEDAATWRAMLTAEHLEQLGVGKKLRGSSLLEKVEVGIGTVDKALSQLRALWVPNLPTSVKQELTGAGGAPLNLNGAPDLSQLSEAQLLQLESLLTVAAKTATPLSPILPPSEGE